MINKCMVCSIGFESPRKRPYCSERCRHKGNYKKKVVQHNCLFCGKEFSATHDSTDFCSNSCREKHNRRAKAETYYCKACGKELGKLVKGKIYCSKECGNVWEKENPRYAKCCLECNGEFKTNNKHQKYCSPECEGKSRRRTISFVCSECGNKFIPKMNDRTTYCSRECYFKAKHKNAKPKINNVIVAKNVLCAECGKEFQTCRGQKYCSDRCRMIHYNTKKKDTFKPLQFECEECGITIVALRGDKRRKFCSHCCSRRHSDRKKETQRRYRLIENGEIDHNITLKKLIKRDNEMCYICNDKVNVNSNSNADEYPSIDHVIPVAKGGTHTWDNVRLAHRYCNSVKWSNMLEDVI